MTSSFFFFSFQHFYDHISVEHDEKPSQPNLTWIGSWWPEIWMHEYLISPIEMSVNWPGSYLFGTRSIYTDFNGAN